MKITPAVDKSALCVWVYVYTECASWSVLVSKSGKHLFEATQARRETCQLDKWTNFSSIIKTRGNLMNYNCYIKLEQLKFCSFSCILKQDGLKVREEVVENKYKNTIQA